LALALALAFGLLPALALLIELHAAVAVAVFGFIWWYVTTPTHHTTHNTKHTPWPLAAGPHLGPLGLLRARASDGRKCRFFFFFCYYNKMTTRNFSSRAIYAERT
jgi:hypothetical protein